MESFADRKGRIRFWPPFYYLAARIFLPFILLSSLIFSEPSSALGQKSLDSGQFKGKNDNYLVAYLGGGVSYYLGDPTLPPNEQTELYRANPIGTLRVLWKSRRLPAAGLETGWISLFSYKIVNSSSGGRSQVSTVPLLFVCSIPIVRQFDLLAGAGAYFITSKYGNAGQSTNVSPGLSLGASYLFPLTDFFGIAGEIKWMDAFKTGDSSISGQLAIRWAFLRW